MDEINTLKTFQDKLVIKILTGRYRKSGPVQMSVLRFVLRVFISQIYNLPYMFQ